ncbi:MAG TPA: polysaccharide deacetylase family protein [Chitinophagaceae bacterium]|nr:polysaccharide deacetylase family protein [Chitinophagaceae bacterium]
MKNRSALFLFPFFFFASCNSTKNETQSFISSDSSSIAKQDFNQQKKQNDLATILSMKEVPVLCYHHIRDRNWPAGSSMIEYDVKIQAFKDQMKSLADSGYKTITPDEYVAYLTTGAPLPDKPVMLTFDDTDKEQYTIGAAEMNKYGFKGVFFLMTISIGRPNYMTKEEIKNLSDSGHIIGAHTWDHHRVTKYTDGDWDKQLSESSKKIEAITGKPVKYFAYPFGLWNQEAIPQLQKRGMQAAFQLSAKRDSLQPLYTLRRMIVPGNWSVNTMHKAMKNTFRQKNADSKSLAAR